MFISFVTISVYSGFGLDRFYCIYVSAQQSAQVDPVSGPTTFHQESDENGRIKIFYISMLYLYTEFPNFDTNRIL
jgi:hypothetical protein